MAKETSVIIFITFAVYFAQVKTCYGQNDLSQQRKESIVEMFALFDYETGQIVYKDDSHKACFVENAQNFGLVEVSIPENISNAQSENLKNLSPLVKKFCQDFQVFALKQFYNSVENATISNSPSIRKKRSAQGGGASQSQVQGQVYGQGFFSGQAQSQASGISQTQVQLSGLGILGSVSSSAGNSQAQIALGENDGSGQAGTFGMGPSNSQVQVNMGQGGRGSMASASVMAGEGGRSTFGDSNTGEQFRSFPSPQSTFRQDAGYQELRNGQNRRSSTSQNIDSSRNGQSAFHGSQFPQYLSRAPASGLTQNGGGYPYPIQNANLPQLPDISNGQNYVSNQNDGREGSRFKTPQSQLGSYTNGLVSSYIRQQQPQLQNNYPAFYPQSPLQSAYPTNGFNQPASTGHRAQTFPSHGYSNGDSPTRTVDLGRGTADFYSSPSFTSNGHRGQQSIPDSSRNQFSQDFGSQRGMFPQRESNGRVTSTQQNTEQNQTRQTIGDGYIPTANGYVRPYLPNKYDTQTYDGENGLSSQTATFTPTTAPHVTFTPISYSPTTFPNYYTTTFTPHLDKNPPQLYNPAPVSQQAILPINNRNYYPAPGQGFRQPADHASEQNLGTSQQFQDSNNGSNGNGRRCSVVTFTCTILIESNGRAKICRPMASQTNGQSVNYGQSQLDHAKSMQICCC